MKSKKLINERTAKSERGAAMIDYAILTCMIAVVSLGSLMAFGNNMQKIFCERIMKINYIDSPGEISVIDWHDENPKNKYCLPRIDSDEAPEPLF